MRRWLLGIQLIAAVGLAPVLVGCGGGESESGPPTTDPVSLAFAPLFAIPAAEVDSQLVAATVASLAATGEFASVRMGLDNATIELVSPEGHRLFVDYYSPQVPDLPDPDSDLEATPNRLALPTPSQSRTDDIVIGAQTALIFAPAGIGLDLEQLREILVAAGLQVDILRGGDCTLDQLDRKLRMEYGVIVFIMHGGVSPDGYTYFALGERFDTDNLTYLLLSDTQRAGVNRYVISNRIETVEEAVECYQHGTGSNCETVMFAVDERFFAGYTFPRTILFLGGCSSYRSENLPNVLRGQGAAAVVGWESLVNPVLNFRTIRQFLWQLGLSFSTTVRGSTVACKTDFKLICPMLGLNGHWGDVSELKGGLGDGGVFMRAPVPLLTPLGGRYDATLIDWDSNYRPSGGHAQRFEFDLALAMGGVVTGDVRVIDATTGDELYRTTVSSGHLSGVNLKLEIPLNDGTLLILSGRNGFEWSEGSLRPSFRTILGTSWFIESGWDGCAEKGHWMAVAGS